MILRIQIFEVYSFKPYYFLSDCVQSLMSSWNHGADPSDFLLINHRVQEFKVNQSNQLLSSERYIILAVLTVIIVLFGHQLFPLIVFVFVHLSFQRPRF